VWDEPNVPPNWGRRNADPVEYAQLLIPTAQALRDQDPSASILLAGLAMNVETRRPHPQYSEILFLRGLYEIDADRYFDIVAAKPYGMWSGPDDRRVHSSVLNFSRLILLREEMRQYGDAETPAWAVEMGWNALPAEWSGAPSPWGTDSEEIQAARLGEALARIDREWNWLTGVFPLVLLPKAEPDDPRWGLALVSPDGEPRAAYRVIHDYVGARGPSPPPQPPSAPWLWTALLTGAVLVATARAWHYLFAAGLDRRWRQLAGQVDDLPGPVAPLAVGLAVALFYLSPSAPLNFVLLAALVVLFALRIDLGLALVAATIPFWNYPKTLFGGFQLPLAEVLTWVSVAAWVINLVLKSPTVRFAGVTDAVKRFSGLDWAVLAFLTLGLVSTQVAANFGVASREFRMVVLDPALFYALVRFSNLTPGQVRRVVYALLASGVAVCAIGLWRFATGDVIEADGVPRIYAVWGSPNNVALYLGRLLPIALALALASREKRWLWAVLTSLFALVILLSFSRGGLFLGAPASALFVVIVLLSEARVRRRTALAVVGSVAVLALVALALLIDTERGQSLFQPGTGTGFFRLAVWTSAVNMIRDHALFGVGLDNFLYEYPRYILPEAWREPNLSHPHNLALDFWVRLGVGGVILAAAMLVLFFRRAWAVFRAPPSAHASPFTHALALGLMGSMVNFIAHGLIDAAYFVVDLAYVFMLTLALIQFGRERD
jgi:O-antigen ligase